MTKSSCLSRSKTTLSLSHFHTHTHLLSRSLSFTPSSSYSLSLSLSPSIAHSHIHYTRHMTARSGTRAPMAHLAFLARRAVCPSRKSSQLLLKHSTRASTTSQQQHQQKPKQDTRCPNHCQPLRACHRARTTVGQERHIKKCAHLLRHIPRSFVLYSSIKGHQGGETQARRRTATRTATTATNDNATRSTRRGTAAARTASALRARSVA